MFELAKVWTFGDDETKRDIGIDAIMNQSKYDLGYLEQLKKKDIRGWNEGDRVREKFENLTDTVAPPLLSAGVGSYRLSLGSHLIEPEVAAAC